MSLLGRSVTVMSWFCEESGKAVRHERHKYNELHEVLSDVKFQDVQFRPFQVHFYSVM